MGGRCRSPSGPHLPAADPHLEHPGLGDLFGWGEQRVAVDEQEIRALARDQPPEAPLGKARIGGTKLDLLTAVTTADPNFWWLEARVIDPNGRELIRQGGFATGSLKPGTGTNSGSWSIELWADLPKGEPFAAALTTR